MASDAEPEATDPRPVRPRKRLLPFLVLAAGGLVAAYLAARSPRDQHLKVVLGADADRITGLEMQYVADDGDVARDVRMAFPEGRAPRVVSHEPKLTDGDYRLRIEIDTREGRRSVERRVTLGGGTTQVDLTGALSAPQAAPSPSSLPSSPSPSPSPFPSPSPPSAPSSPRTAP